LTFLTGILLFLVTKWLILTDCSDKMAYFFGEWSR